MCFFFSLIPATMFTVVGYFVLFSSTKAEGRVRQFGRLGVAVREVGGVRIAHTQIMKVVEV